MSKLSKKLSLMEMNIEPVSRNPFLRSIEGKYTYCNLVSNFDIPTFISMRNFCLDEGFWINGTKRTTPRGMNISRALVKVGFSSDDVSRFMNCIVDETFHISCKFNDIVRLGESHNFTSCLNYKNGAYRKSLSWFLRNPDIAIVFIPDRSGQFQSRATLISTIRGLAVTNSHGPLYDSNWYQILKSVGIPVTKESDYGYSKIYDPITKDYDRYTSLCREYHHEQHKLRYIL